MKYDPENGAFALKTVEVCLREKTKNQEENYTQTVIQ